MSLFFIKDLLNGLYIHVVLQENFLSKDFLNSKEFTITSSARLIRNLYKKFLIIFCDQPDGAELDLVIIFVFKIFEL